MFCSLSRMVVSRLTAEVGTSVERTRAHCERRREGRVLDPGGRARASPGGSRTRWLRTNTR
jgi:hypothetical protein